MRPKRELLEIVRSKERACVDRGEAIDELVKSGMSQLAIAESTNLSTSAISHLKKCFRNLTGQAREMCKAARMNGDACYSLASSDLDREQLFRSAMQIRAKKDAGRSGQNMGPKGRQTPEGQITDEDVKEAIRDLTKKLKAK